MRNFFRSVRLCLLGLAFSLPLTAQSPVDQQVAEGTANIYNLTVTHASAASRFMVRSAKLWRAKP
jgi:hypothetical protein